MVQIIHGMKSPVTIRISGSTTSEQHIPSCQLIL